MTGTEHTQAAPASARPGLALVRTLNVFFLVLVHSSLVFVFLVPFSWSLIALWAVSHFGRILGITLAFHRHLAHGAFEMGRATRFVWTWIGTSAMQTGPLWWAGTHVDHHRYADREGDPHSPRLRGFLGAHVGWILDGTSAGEVPRDNPVVRRFLGHPEIRFLEQFYYVPPLLLAGGLFAVGGWPWLVWGFGLATTTVFHGTFAINSVNHLWGTRRFATPDDSRNNLATALLALGEGWHNNHHRYPLAARNGFYWWEPDVTWWVIRLMGSLGLAWDIRPVPSRVYQEAKAGLAGVPGDLEKESRGQRAPKPLAATPRAEQRSGLSAEQAGLQWLDEE